MKQGTAVTGLGCLCAAGDTLEEVAHTLSTGRRSPAPPQRIEVQLDDPCPVFEVMSDPAERIEVDPGASPSRTALMALAAVTEACSQARLDHSALDRDRTGVCLGTTVGCTLNDEPFYRDFRAGRGPGLEPVERYLRNNPALMVAQALGLTGPAVTVTTACSSGTDAIGLGKDWIRSGLCDIVIAGGADELSRITVLGFTHLMVVSAEPCRPFDRDRSGLNLGEGAGIVILESAESAERRGVAPLAWLSGYGCRTDAHHLTAPHPEGRGLRGAIEMALREAGIDASEIGFVNAHGTATRDNDRIEGRVLAEMFGDDIPVVATKSHTGHTLGAAGGVEAVLTVHSLLSGRLPPTTGHQVPDPECHVRATTRCIEHSARCALSDSLAFGGGNAALVFERCD